MPIGESEKVDKIIGFVWWPVPDVGFQRGSRFFVYGIVFDLSIMNKVLVIFIMK